MACSFVFMCPSAVALAPTPSGWTPLVQLRPVTDHSPSLPFAWCASRSAPTVVSMTIGCSPTGGASTRDAITPPVGMAAPHAPSPEARPWDLCHQAVFLNTAVLTSLFTCTSLAAVSGCGPPPHTPIHTLIPASSQLCLHTAALTRLPPSIGWLLHTGILVLTPDGMWIDVHSPTQGKNYALCRLYAGMAAHLTCLSQFPCFSLIAYSEISHTCLPLIYPPPFFGAISPHSGDYLFATGKIRRPLWTRFGDFAYWHKDFPRHLWTPAASKWPFICMSFTPHMSLIM